MGCWQSELFAGVEGGVMLFLGSRGLKRNARRVFVGCATSDDGFGHVCSPTPLAWCAILLAEEEGRLFPAWQRHADEAEVVCERRRGSVARYF